MQNLGGSSNLVKYILLYKTFVKMQHLGGNSNLVKYIYLYKTYI